MKTKNVKLSAIIINITAIVIITAILIGATFAWFTDSAVSSGNKIQAGTLKIDLELLDNEGNWASIKDDSTPIFNYDKWEPGYTDIKILKIENEGTLALKWKAKFVSENDLSKLANVIDVYVLPSSTELSYPADRSLDGYYCVGTLAEFVNTIETTTTGTLLAGESAYLGIALQMRTTAGNEYQGLDLGGMIDIMIIATQLSSEEDGFDNGYDSEATLDWSIVANENQLRRALANKEPNIILEEDILIDNSFSVDVDTNINGNGHSLLRTSGVATYSAEETTPYTGTVFNVAANTTLTLTNIKIDGGAVWVDGGEGVDPVLGRGTSNVGVTATGPLVNANSQSQIILSEGAVLQNNCGNVAVNLGTRIGATLTLEGGEIINNHSEAGAIWGGGNIIINAGKINNNSSSGLAGAIRMVSNCHLTMNGGEIKNNKATSTGGAIYGYGASTYNLNGGEISGNAADVGGAFYPGDSSTINITGNFKLTNNTANQAGGMRLSNRTTLNMSGGVISGNVSSNSPTWNGLYGWNLALNLTGGILADDIVIQSGLGQNIGGAAIAGVIHFDLGTTHNTCNLGDDFGVFKFTVAESANFANFNFKPSATYVYTEGDEDKLICLNEGYETYYDAATGTFRLQAAD